MQPLNRKKYLLWREKCVRDLAKQNPEYEYVYQKKYPDPALPHRVWIQKLATEMKI